MSDRLDPAVAHRIDARTILALLPNCDQMYLSDVRLNLARHIQSLRISGTATTWQDAWNDFVQATPARGGQIRLPGAMCPQCRGRGYDTRHAAQNFARTGHPAVCGECRGTRRTTVVLRARFAPTP